MRKGRKMYGKIRLFSLGINHRKPVLPIILLFLFCRSSVIIGLVFHCFPEFQSSTIPDGILPDDEITRCNCYFSVNTLPSHPSRTPVITEAVIELKNSSTNFNKIWIVLMISNFYQPFLERLHDKFRPYHTFYIRIQVISENHHLILYLMLTYRSFRIVIIKTVLFHFSLLPALLW